MVGDVGIAPVVVAIVERLESLVGLPYRVGRRSPSTASPADDTRFVRAFGDVSHNGSVKVWVTAVSVHIPMICCHRHP
jgi:hypothetical protein